MNTWNTHGVVSAHHSNIIIDCYVVIDRALRTSSCNLIEDWTVSYRGLDFTFPAVFIKFSDFVSARTNYHFIPILASSSPLPDLTLHL